MQKAGVFNLIEGLIRSNTYRVLSILFFLASLLVIAGIWGILSFASTANDQVQSRNEASGGAQAVNNSAKKSLDNDLYTKEPMSSKVSPNGKFLESEIVVKFKDNVNKTEQSRLLRDNKLFVKRESKYGGMLLKVNAGDELHLVDVLKNDSRVELVGLNSKREFQSCVPNDPYYCDPNDYQWQLKKIHAPMGWNYKTGSSSVIVAVLDGGVDYTHADLQNRMWVNSDEIAGNFVDDDYNGNIDDVRGWDYWNDDSDPMDDSDISHGTRVAGIIAATTNNSFGIAGVDWNAKIMPVKISSVGGATSAYTIREGIHYAVDNGAKVINISSTGEETSDWEQEGVNYANQNGVVVVASAMNSPDPNCFIGFPAALPTVISVAATDRNNNLGSGCTGSVKDGHFYSILKLTAPGQDVYSTTRGGGISNGGAVWTSYAAPFVSGVASILSSCSLNGSQISLDLFDGSKDLGAPGWDSNYGYGLVNLYGSLMRTCVDPIGDVDCNGIIQASDATHILRYVAGLEGLTWDCEPGKMHRPEANVDRDGDVDAVDALYVLQYTAGIRTTQTQALVPPNTDTDGDGMTNQQEAQYSCLNANVADATANPDNDSVSVPNINVNMNNAAELAMGTNPCVADTDGDGFSDGVEVYVGTDAKVRCGTNAWPADFNNDRQVSILDLVSFLAPIYRLYASPGQASFDRRWDIVPGSGGLGDFINITDLSLLITVSPPMFGGQRAYFGPACTP